MKGFIVILLCLILTGGIIYIVPSFRAKSMEALTYNACDTPLAYRLGSIDQRFGLSNDAVQQDISEASSIWDNAEGKNLFMYSPNASLTINFVYDQRQALDSSISQLQDKLTQNNATLSQQIAQYKADEAAFLQKLNALNATIEQYNQKGGAPQPIYDQLMQQQQELDKEGQALNQRAKQLNLSTSDYNSNVSVLNNDINKFQQVLNQKPEEGLFNGGNETISIYFANNRPELIHTLTHELGHALGMMHVGDPIAIMYPYTTAHLAVTADDMKQLAYVCRNQSAVIHGLQVFDIWIMSQTQSLQKLLTK